MMRIFKGLTVLLVLGSPGLAFAQQPMESVGSRAIGMAGAFVAVADDGTASYWNPAGLATGGPAGATAGWARFRTGNQAGSPVVGATRGSSLFVGVGTWPLGLTYGRFSATRVTSVDGAQASTQTLTTQQYGVNVLQTLVPRLVVGATVKLVHGTVARAEGSSVSADALFGDATALSSHGSTTVDVDAGAMLDLDRARLGVTLKNLRRPEFTDVVGIAIRVDRQARAGVAILPRDGLTLALDVDLDTVDLWDGPRRVIAGGVEDRVTSRVMARAGVRWNLEDRSPRPVYAAGASVRLSTSTWLDGHVTYGNTARDRGFGVALRAGY